MEAKCPITENANSNYLIVLKIQKPRGSVRDLSLSELQGPITWASETLPQKPKPKQANQTLQLVEIY